MDVIKQVVYEPTEKTAHYTHSTAVVMKIKAGNVSNWVQVLDYFRNIGLAVIKERNRC